MARSKPLKRPRLPCPSSRLEELFALQVRAIKAPAPVREYRFAPPRRFRFDFAWPSLMLAVEIEGGIWSRGRHVRPAGYAADMEKYNAAALAGWTVLRFTGDMVKSGLAIETISGRIMLS